MLVKRCFNADYSPGLSLSSEPHRAVFTDTSLCEGTMVASLYLRQGEGMSPANRAILEETAAELASLAGPWIIGMDANMSPEALQKSGWPDMVGGHIVAPDIPTCGPSANDYFIVSKQLAPAVHAVQLSSNAGTNPHQAVRLLIKAGTARRFRRQIAKPTHIPGRLPAGPYDEPTHQLFCRPQSDDHSSDTRGAEEHAKDWVAKARGTFARILGKDVGEDGRARVVWTDKASAPRRTDSPSQHIAATWRSVGNATHKLAAAIRKHHAADGADTRIGPLFWGTYQTAEALMKSDKMELTREECKEWLAAFSNLRTNAVVPSQIPPQSVARQAALALKMAQRHVTPQVAEMKDDKKANEQLHASIQSQLATVH